MHGHLLDHSIYMHKAMPIGATAHQAGTVRFGTDPASSALDPNCKAHDLDNQCVGRMKAFPQAYAFVGDDGVSHPLMLDRESALQRLSLVGAAQ